MRVEGPVDEASLIEKLCAVYSVPKTAKKAVQRLNEIAAGTENFRRESLGIAYYADKETETFRPLDDRVKRDYSRVCPYELIAAARCALECSGSLNKSELIREILTLMNCTRKTAKASEWTESALELAVKEGYVILTVDGNYTV